jgi:hypothetical protein
MLYFEDNSFRILIMFHQTTCCHTPEDSNLHTHCCDKLGLTSHSSFSVTKIACLPGFLFSFFLLFDFAFGSLSVFNGSSFILLFQVFCRCHLCFKSHNKGLGLCASCYLAYPCTQLLNGILLHLTT